MSDQEISETLKAVLTREIPLEYYGAADVVGIFADQAMVSLRGLVGEDYGVVEKILKRPRY